MKFPVMERKYMRGTLTIKVRYQSPSMKCTVNYGLRSIDLPRHLDELRSGIRGVSDSEDAERLYKIIEKEVNDMLRDYYLNYNCSGNLIGQDGVMAEQFDFPEIPTINTYNVQNGQIHIMAGATPTHLGPMLHPGPIDYVDRHVPHIEYISKEEFYEKDKAGGLESGTVYCVLN